MNTLAFLGLALIILLAQTTFAQTSRRDSITHRYDSLSKVKLNLLDSSGKGINKKIDSSQDKITNLLNPNLDLLSIKEGRNKIDKRKARKDSATFYKSIRSERAWLKLKMDSLEKAGVSSQQYALQLDSLNKVKYQPAADSAAIKRNKRKQKVIQQQGRVNSILNPDLNTLSRSGQSKLQKRKAKKDSIAFVNELEIKKLILNEKIDSLQKAGLSMEKYTRQLDSLNKLSYHPSSSKVNQLAHKLDSIKSVNPTQPLNGAQQKINGVEQKIAKPADKIENEVNDKLSLMNKEGGAGANLPGNISTPNNLLPTNSLHNTSLPLPSTSLPSTSDFKSNLSINNPVKDQLSGVNEAKDKVTGVQNLPQQQIGKLKSNDEVEAIQEKLGAANKITDKAQSYQGDVKNLAEGNLKEVKELPKEAEAQAGKLGMNELKKETSQFDQYKQLTDKAKNPEEVKKQAIQEVTKKAVDHFAGKEQVLHSAMDNMSKLKSKYSSINSVKEIPKHKPNEMKNKPLIERFVPGVTFQFQKSADLIIDYNPYIGYRFYGRFTAGVGWNERVSIGKRMSFSLRDRIYGPRVFADFKLTKGFSVRTDIEKMNTYVPALTSNGYSTDTEYRAWVWSAFVGLKKEYTFIKKVKGTAQFLYNLYDDHNNSPYADRFAVRMGFEFPMKKKLKAKKETSK